MEIKYTVIKILNCQGRIRAEGAGVSAVSAVDTLDHRRLQLALLVELPPNRAVAVAARLTGLRKKNRKSGQLWRLDLEIRIESPIFYA